MMFSYNLIRSNRKTIQIQILPDKTIEVRAPKYVSDKRIRSFINSKEKWITAKIQEKKEIVQIPINHFYVVGETFYYRGKQYILKSCDESINKSAVYLSGNNLIIQTRAKTPKAFQNTFVRWQKERAWEIFNELFEECWIHFSKYYPNHKKPFLSLRTMKTRWGSLSKKTDLQPAKVTLNTLLICSSNNCIKQVIYHELCHLIHPNHGKGFYEIFGFFVPDWKILKKELEYLFVIKD